MNRLARLVTGRRSRWAVLAAWLVAALALAPLQGSLQRAAADESDAFVAASAESTRAGKLIDTRFSAGSEVSTVIAYRPADDPRIQTDAQQLCAPGTLSHVVRVITPTGLACGKIDDVGPSSPAVGPVTPERDVALVTVQTRDDATQVVERDVATIRKIVPDTALVTGETAFAADQSAAVEGIDGTLLTITAALILVLLLVVYRSPVAAAVPLVIVSLAYLVAAGVVYGLTRAGVIDVTGQATAILIVLMFGAGTDYCLLLVARYREELQRGMPDALQAATRRSAPAILSAGAIVIAAMLVLTLADYRATATMGPVLAVGMAITVLAGLTLLPALLAILGQAAFWPAQPRAAGRTWPAIGRIVRHKPLITIAAVGALLVVGALGSLNPPRSLSFAESFRDTPESVQAQDLIAKRYKPGLLGPAEAVVSPKQSGAVVEQLTHTPGVLWAAAMANSRDGKLTKLEIITTADPFTEAARDGVPALRDTLQTIDKTALLGGPAAEAFDARQALHDDAALIVPLTLILVLAVIGLLVRALIAPIYLVATVLLSYAFALGVSALLFDATDPALPTFAFIFLVALGVDYNVFLITRIREERAGRDSRDAVISGLERSGGVITSAGLILAGTFLALVAVDMVSLAQIGFTVALGLLVDTFLVRCFLVPAIAVVLGDRSWWPLPPVVAVVLVAFALLVTVGPGIASADTFTVRSVGDRGPGTLREALEAAEANAEPDLIDVRATGTVQLESQLPDLHTTLAIDGPGADRLKLARASGAEQPFRPLTVGPGGDVAISGLTLTGGYIAERSSPRGGGVFNQGRLALRDTVVAGNTVAGQIGISGGGGVANAGTLALERSVVRDNRVSSSEGDVAGGGVYNVGSLALRDTLVAGNTGGIEQAAGLATISRSTVTGNAGTGIHNDFADLVVEDTTVAGNGAQITATGGQTTIRRATLQGPGANLATFYVDIPSSLTVEGTTFSGGAPDCTFAAQVNVTWLAGNVSGDGSCPATPPVANVTAPATPVPTALHTAPSAAPAKLAPLRIRRSGTTLRVTVPAAGALRLGGAGVRAITRHTTRPGVVRLAVRSTRRRAHVHLTFRPLQGAIQERSITIEITRGRGTR